MAQEALQKLEDQLNCSICLDIYTDPKQLHCNHVYCQKCLVKLVIRDQHGQLILSCPICRQVTPVPANGVAGLQSAFHINHLLEIQDAVKKINASPPCQGGAVDSATSSSQYIFASTVKHCFEHDEELKLYCETCGQLICFHCIMKSGKHHNHDYELLNEAHENYKREVTSSLEPMEKQLTTINKALTHLETFCGAISNQRAAIEDKIHSTFRQLQQIIDPRKTEVIGQLHQMAQAQMKAVAVQRDQLETTQAQLSSCLYSVKESLKTGNQGDVLSIKKTLLQQVKELTTAFQPSLLEPNVEIDITFSASESFPAVCKNYGQLFAPGLPDPSKCHATGKGIEATACSVGETSTAVLQVINFNGLPCKKPIKSLECELVSEMTGTRAQVSVQRRGQSQYDISYQPGVKGRNHLHITIEGKHIRGSPFSIAAKSPIEKLGTPILNVGGVKGPWGVVINQSGMVVLTEHEGDCISVLSPSGQKLRSFGAHGSSHGQFKNIKGVTVDDEGNILVTDSKNHRIQKFSAEGQFLAAQGTQGIKALQFESPSDIAFNASNSKLYVVDSHNHRIQILNLTSPSQAPSGGFWGAVARDSSALHMVLPVTVLGRCM